MEIEEDSLDIERAGEERTFPPAMYGVPAHICWIPTSMKSGCMFAGSAWGSLQLAGAAFANDVRFHGAKFALELLA